MTRIENVFGNVLSTPVIEMESPFYITFDVIVKRDVIHCTFLGDMARALKNNIRPGDQFMVPRALVDEGRMVFDFMHLDVDTAKGRNINAYA